MKSILLAPFAMLLFAAPAMASTCHIFGFGVPVSFNVDTGAYHWTLHGQGRDGQMQGVRRSQNLLVFSTPGGSLYRLHRTGTGWSGTYQDSSDGSVKHIKASCD